MKPQALLLIAIVACGKSKTSEPAPAAAPVVIDTAPAPVVIDAAPFAPPAPPGIPSFEDSLARAKMTFAMPAGFTRITPVDNPQWKYAFAMRSEKPPFEVWIRIDPLDEELAEARRCKQDPSCHGTDPNQRHQMWLMTIAANIGGARGGLPEVRELDPAKVKQDFNADWGGFATVSPPDPVFKTTFPRVIVVLVHKDDRADAVIAIAAGDDLTPDDLYRALDGLKFVP